MISVKNAWVGRRDLAKKEPWTVANQGSVSNG